MPRTKGAHNEATPLVENGKLYLPTSNRPVAYVGSQKWFNWLSGRTPANGHSTGDQKNYSSFYFKDGPLVMTCILQRRKSRGNEYTAWLGYRTKNGKRRNVYLGQSEKLTLEHLREKALALA